MCDQVIKKSSFNRLHCKPAAAFFQHTTKTLKRRRTWSTLNWLAVAVSTFHTDYQAM